MTGSWFEYIVAHAVIAQNFPDWQSKIIRIYYGPFSTYLERIDNEDTDTIVVLFPQEQAGPDVVIKKGIRLIVAQIKFLKDIIPSKLKIAISTTDPDIFYKSRKAPHAVLRGWSIERDSVFRTINGRATGIPLQLERKVVMYLGANYSVNTLGYDSNAELITQNTAPDFFQVVAPNTNVWKLLDETRDALNQVYGNNNHIRPQEV